ncbi:MAG: DUF4954 family protein, partial [Bacteroidaceae bacterium]
MEKKSYRKLRREEIDKLVAQLCLADDWAKIDVDDGFSTEYIRDVRFSGTIKLGIFEKTFLLPGGVTKHSGLSHVTLCHVAVGDNCCIENIQNYIANYEIGEDSFIENVDEIVVTEKSRFGNGVAVSVLNENGGREVLINDKLSAHLAYIAALYRHYPNLIDKINAITEHYAEKHASEIGTIGKNVTILNTGSIKNV